MNISGEKVNLASIFGHLVEITVSKSVPADSTEVTIKSYAVDEIERRLSPAVHQQSSNIAQHRAAVYSFGEVSNAETEICGFFILLGPIDHVHDQTADDSKFCLYLIDERLCLILFAEYHLPVTVSGSIGDCIFHLIDGPRICFSYENTICVAMHEGNIQKHTMAASVRGFRLLSCWCCDDSRVFMLGTQTNDDVSDSEPHRSPALTFGSVFVNTSECTLQRCPQSVIPDIYADIITCIRLSSLCIIPVDRSSSTMFDLEAAPVASNISLESSLVYACTSYSQLVECRSGQLSNCVALPFNDALSIDESPSRPGSPTVLIIRSQAHKVAVVSTTKFEVLYTLDDVESALFGDFLACGSCQTLFLSPGRLPSTDDDMDILDIVDAGASRGGMQRSFGDRFLLTDFADILVDCWHVSEERSACNAEDSSTAVSDAVKALRCRLSAGRSQLAAARLSCDVKRSLIANTVQCLSSVHSTATCQPLTVPLVSLARGTNCQPETNVPVPRISQPSTSSTPSSPVDVGHAWHKVVNNHWVIGVRLFCRSRSPLRDVNLILVPSSTFQFDFTSQCFVHSLRLLPERSSAPPFSFAADQKPFQEPPAKQYKADEPTSTGADNQTETDRIIYSPHELKQTCVLKFAQSAHVVATVSNLFRSSEIAFRDVSCSLILSWLEEPKESEDARGFDGNLLRRFLPCGELSLSTSAALLGDNSLDFKQTAPMSDEYVVESLLSVRAVLPFSRAMLLKSLNTARCSTDREAMFGSLRSALVDRFKFVVWLQCFVCTCPTSPFFLTCVEVIDARVYNVMKFHLSSRSEAEMLLLIRGLYETLPGNLIIVPDNDAELTAVTKSALQAMQQEVLASLSALETNDKNSKQSTVSASVASAVSMNTDRSVLELLHRLK